jgi:exonuclease VII large subunit
VVRSAESVSPGERVSVRLAAGRLGCVVDRIEMEE